MGTVCPRRLYISGFGVLMITKLYPIINVHQNHHEYFYNSEWTKCFSIVTRGYFFVEILLGNFSLKLCLTCLFNLSVQNLSLKICSLLLILCLRATRAQLMRIPQSTDSGLETLPISPITLCILSLDMKTKAVQQVPKIT